MATSAQPGCPAEALAAKYFGTQPKIRRGRGKAQKSLDLIEAMHEIAERLHPITVRGIACKLFARDLIASMKAKETKRVSRLLVDAREDGLIPWEWIVDETRELEEVPSWRDPRVRLICRPMAAMQLERELGVGPRIRAVVIELECDVRSHA